MVRAWWVVLLAAVAIPCRGWAEEAEKREAKDIVADLRSEETEVRRAAIEESKGCADASVTTELIKLLHEKDDELRVAVVDALAARTEKPCRKRAAAALAPRLAALAKNVAHETEYVATIQALKDLAQPGAIRALMDFEIQEPPETAEARLMAVASTPCAEAIDSLIGFLSKGRNRGRNEQRQACVAALRYATGEKFGNDPDRWRAWWREAKKDFDFEAIAEERAARESAEAEKRARREERRKKREDPDGGGSGGDG